MEIKPMTKEDTERLVAEHNQLNPKRDIRQEVVKSLENYVNLGIEPGGFLRAVLENNLMEAMGRADSYNRASLFEICGYIYNEMPASCHGSPEAVFDWIKERTTHPLGCPTDTLSKPQET